MWKPVKVLRDGRVSNKGSCGRMEGGLSHKVGDIDRLSQDGGPGRSPQPIP